MTNAILARAITTDVMLPGQYYKCNKDARAMTNAISHHKHKYHQESSRTYVRVRENILCKVENYVGYSSVAGIDAWRRPAHSI